MSTSATTSRSISGDERLAKQVVKSFLHHLKYTQGKHWADATPHDQWMSLCMAVRDRIIDRLSETQRTYHESDCKRVYYMSMEYLLGRQLRQNLVNLGLLEGVRRGLREMDVDLESLCDVEPDAGLGNGGLGRLAACFMDSLATLELPAYGYGVRYEYGIFDQDIVDGWQVERPDYWLRMGSPWELARPEYTNPVRFYGRVEDRNDAQGRYRPAWVDCRTVMGVPYDVPIVGYGGKSVNLLRLWSARASQTFDLAAFNRGGYVEAVREKAISETISKVLYPNDQTEAGRELRLVQQYFFVACTLADLMRRHEKQHDSVEDLPNKMAIQLNDTHPSLAVAELMRIFLDEKGLEWDAAWEITRGTIAFTNHTLMPEALEVWPVALLGHVLPRHMQIILEINRRFLNAVQDRWPNDMARMQRMSIVREGPVRAVRMAHLAMVGSHKINGVAKLHSELIRKRLVPDFAEMWPERFTNKTNGVTPRRWLLACNPRLAEAITARIGDKWTSDLERLHEIEKFADEPDFHGQLRAVKYANKQAISEWLRRRHGFKASPEAMFDVQVKRIHEYKRQLLNVLQVIIRYHRILANPTVDTPQRVVFFAGKAAPSYMTAKLIIKLICDVAQTVNNDKRIGEKLRVYFLPNYNVSMAERIIPASDLSEQISTAGMEASGTGNMKFAMNGALTIGTYDGANIEIREAVGEENFFLFGLTEEQIAKTRAAYDPAEVYRKQPAVQHALDAVRDGAFDRANPGLFQPLVHSLLYGGDPYMIMADLPAYLAAQDRVDQAWKEPRGWIRRTIVNIARMGRFSSDRTIHEYASDVWGIERIGVKRGKS